MSKDPSAFFGGLLRSCIRDDHFEDRNMVRESLIFTFLGIGSSVLTVYALSLLGLLV
jgi:hypothetical protein